MFPKANTTKEDFTCPLCMKILRDPQQCPDLHAFCSSCIHAWIAEKGPGCPVGGESLTPDELTAAGILNYLMANVETDCLFSDKGCNARLELRELREHVEDYCELNPDRKLPSARDSKKLLSSEELEENILEEAVRRLNMENEKRRLSRQASKLQDLKLFQASIGADTPNSQPATPRAKSPPPGPLSTRSPAVVPSTADGPTSGRLGPGTVAKRAVRLSNTESITEEDDPDARRRRRVKKRASSLSVTIAESSDSGGKGGKGSKGGHRPSSEDQSTPQLANSVQQLANSVPVLAVAQPKTKTEQQFDEQSANLAPSVLMRQSPEYQSARPLSYHRQPSSSSWSLLNSASTAGLSGQLRTKYAQLIHELAQNGTIRRAGVREALLATELKLEESADTMRSIVTRWATNLDAVAAYLQPGARVLVLSDLVWYSACIGRLLTIIGGNTKAASKSLVVCPGNPALLFRYDTSGKESLRRRVHVEAGRDLYTEGYSKHAPYDVIVSSGRVNGTAIRKQVREPGGVVFDFENRVEFTAEMGVRETSAIGLDLNRPNFKAAVEQVFKRKPSQLLDDLLRVIKPGDRVLFSYSDYSIALVVAAALDGSIGGKVTCFRNVSLEEQLRADGLGWLFDQETFEVKSPAGTGTKKRTLRKRTKESDETYTIIVAPAGSLSKQLLDKVSPFGGIVFDLHGNKIIHERRAIKYTLLN